MKTKKVIANVLLATSLTIAHASYATMSERINYSPTSYTFDDFKSLLGDRWTCLSLSRRQEMEKDWKDSVEKEDKKMKITIIDIYRSPKVIYDKLKQYEREYINDYKIQSEDLKMIPWIIPGSNTLEDKLLIYTIKKRYPLLFK